MKLYKNWTEISDKSHGIMNQNEYVLVKIAIDMYGGGQKKGLTMSVYSHLLNTVEAPSWFGVT